MTESDPRVVVARLFGRLLLREVDQETLVELREPEIAAALAEVGIELPEAEQLEQLEAEFFEQILQPRGKGPLVQSLWRDGKYEGEAAVSVRKVAAAAGLELGQGALGAAPDHLGCLLTLWAELRERGAAIAPQFAASHLAWVAGSSAPHAASGFYGAVQRAAAALCVDIVGE